MRSFLRSTRGALLVILGVVAVVLIVALAVNNLHWGNGDGNITVKAQAATCPGDHEVKAGETYDVPAGCNVKGDVEVMENGSFVKKFDDDPATGLLVSCPQGCSIKAPYGANVSPRTVPDLESEMKSSGCTGGCKSVTKVTIGTVSPDTGKSGATATAVPSTGSPVNCDPSIEKGKSMLVPKNCVVEGDVAVGMSESGPWTKLYDNDQTTGLVVVTKADVWVKAPYGASASGVSVSDAVSDVFDLGCGLDRGCYGGVDTVTVDVQNGQLVISHGGVKKPK